MNKYILAFLGMIHQSKQTSQISHTHQRLMIKTSEEWHTFWQEQDQPWRTEPEIPVERQQELSRSRFITPEIEKGIYPFRGMKLNRADVEWLLATHENGRGPIDASNESQHGRKGLDLRGADLSHANLYNLPLTRLQGGLTPHEWIMASPEHRNMAVIHLEETLLGSVFLEEAELQGAHMERADLRGAHLEQARLIDAHLEEADLRDAHLERAGLYGARLEQAMLMRAHLEGALLGRTPPEGQQPVERMVSRGPKVGPFMRHVATFPGGAYLMDADLSDAHAEGAELWDANLEGAKLVKTHLEGARLIHAHMDRALLQGAILAGADLTDAHLEGADLRWTHFEGRDVSHEDRERISAWVPTFPKRLPAADLQYVRFDDSTFLDSVIFGKKKEGCVQLVGVRWGNADLSSIDWKSIDKLGDEYKAQQRTISEGKAKTVETRLDEYQRAVRANRQLSTVLQAQGLNEEAAHFAYRAHTLQRATLRLQFLQPHTKPMLRLRTFFSWVFSLFLALIAGYGYRPGRSILAYLIIIFGFMGLYLVTTLLGGPHLRLDEALVLSVSSFHGRGFFSQNITLGDAYARIAALEAVVGLLIEISFIATFTQRFLGK